MSLSDSTDKKKKTKKTPEAETEEDLQPLPDFPIVFNMGPEDGESKEKIRTIGLYGTIKEEVCSEIVYSLIVLDKTCGVDFCTGGPRQYGVVQIST